jgi:hypothetical protein
MSIEIQPSADIESRTFELTSAPPDLTPLWDPSLFAFG